MNHLSMGLFAGTITVYVPKCVAGHHFENLGMITSLLSKKPPAAKVGSKPLIEVLPGYYSLYLHKRLFVTSFTFETVYRDSCETLNRVLSVC